MTSSKTKTTEQHRKFVETARQLECDEDKARFEAKMKRIVKVKPKPKPKKEGGSE